MKDLKKERGRKIIKQKKERRKGRQAERIFSG